jgi:antitoxin HicB
MRNLTYRTLFHKEPEGGYTVIVPALPGCITYGETLDEALFMAKDAITLYLESLSEHGDPIPTEDDTFEHLISIAV